jgi:uncharacterized repeat protein (TIGR01451 family)
MTFATILSGFKPVDTGRLRSIARSRMTALLAILSLNLLAAAVPVTALASVAYQACSASSPLAAGTPPCLFANFEMDGNTPVDTSPGVDWSTSPFPYNRSDFTDLSSSTSDDGFVQGSDYLSQSAWVCTAHKSTPKDDLAGGSIAFGNASVGGNTHQLGYFQFNRVAGNGDTFVDFAFSKAAPPPAASTSCTGLPARQVGDVVISFVFTNGGGTDIVDAATWNGSSFTPLSTGSLGVDFVAAFSADGTYGEGALDMTASGVGPFTCHQFGSVYMDSHASGQNTSNEMKDFITAGLPPLCKTPTVATVSSSTGSVAAGTVAHDTATVSGTAGSGNPTGSVDFRLCGPLASATGCATGGTDIGSTSTSTPGTTNGNPTESFTSGNSGAINAIGTYCWGADYTAGLTTNYNNASGPIDAGNECFKVVGSTATATTSSATGAQLPGVSVTDTASVTLSAPATGAAPVGTVTFKLCDPSAACTQVGSPVALSGGSATSTPAVDGTTTPNTLAIGTYCWEATYSPTRGSSYNGSSELSHPAAECFTTGKQPTSTTTGVLSQTVDVRSGSAGVHDDADTPVFAPASTSFTPGTVTFRLYGPNSTANCGSRLVYTSAAIAGSYAAGHVTAATGSLSLATAGISTSGTYWWVATYSGDAYNNGSSSTCGSEAVQAVDASIAISPQTATNEVGSAHVFTITFTAVTAGATASGFHISPSINTTANLTQNANTCAAPTVAANTATCTYTINASATGTYVLNATGSATMGGLLVTRSTSGDPGPGGTGGATKHYVDASIGITPHSATNEVGVDHVFTITYTAAAGSAGAPTGFSISPSISPAPGTSSTTCDSPTIAGNVATCTYTINSSSAGTFTLNASGSSTMDGVTVTRSTSGNAGPGGTTGAVKHYVDASIGISPATATNVVGQAHVFTITLTAFPGGGGGPTGFSISPSISPTTGLTQNASTCASPVVAGNVATCTFTINSGATGTYSLDATGSVTMGGVLVTRSTTGNHGPGGTGTATKHYVSAALTVTPSSATNEVGQAHVFTITLTANPGEAGAPSNFVITPSVSPMNNLTQNTTTCASPGIEGNVATCTYTINADTAGTYVLNASGQVTMDGQTIQLTTVGGAGTHGPATKHYVDASIAVSPLRATNVITHQHVFTITLTAIPGSTGVPGGFGISPSLSPTANLTTDTNTCATPSVVGNVATCTYTINSATEGTYVLNATGSVTMGGVTVTRSTSGNPGPGGSGAATKNYVAPDSTLVKAERDVTTPDTSQNAGGFAAGPIAASMGDVLEYRLTYANAGRGAAGHVVVTDVVPTAHAAYLPASCTGGLSCSFSSGTNTLTWSLGNMAPGSSAVLTFRITLATDFPVGVLTQVSNFGVVTSAEEGSKPSNTVVANVQPAQAVLAATVTLPRAGFQPGTQGPDWPAVGLLALLLLALAGSASILAVRAAPTSTEDTVQ